MYFTATKIKDAKGPRESRKLLNCGLKYKLTNKKGNTNPKKNNAWPPITYRHSAPFFHAPFATLTGFKIDSSLQKLAIPI